MYLIYWKNKVGQAVAALCAYRQIAYEICDDADAPADFSHYDAIIPSPWIPETHPVYATGKVLAELDFAYQYLPDTFETIAITGTDGKSTTAWILFSLLQKEFFSKKNVYLSGNFEIPFSETVLEILQNHEKRGIIVLEVSSFMAHSIRHFSPDYSIFTNFKSDHLNWHRDLQGYLDAKMNLIAHTKKQSMMNMEIADFAREHGLHISPPENVRWFGTAPDLRDRTDGENITISGRKKYRLSETNFSWLHNAMNVLSATLVTNAMRICSKRTRKYLQDISGLAHRIEKIGEKNGVTFVDDSKSTSAQSLEAALGSFGNTKNLLLIVGGSDKGDTFGNLSQKFALRVKAMVCIGATKSQFVAIAEQEKIPYLATDSLPDGVKWLYGLWSAGDVLMLSPGCASFGLFRDYLDRANQFREVVGKL